MKYAWILEPPNSMAWVFPTANAKWISSGNYSYNKQINDGVMFLVRQRFARDILTAALTSPVFQ